MTAAAAWITRLLDPRVLALCLSSCETVRIETAGAGVQDNRKSSVRTAGLESRAERCLPALSFARRSYVYGPRGP